MNTNCLKGVMCPKCGHTERFAFLVSMWVIVEDEGTDPNVAQAIEWDENTMVACKACDHREQLANFTLPGFYVTFDITAEDDAGDLQVDRGGWWEPGGWEYDDKPDEPAYSFDPADDFDEDEHEDINEAIVDWAVVLLEGEGATHFSGSDWFSTEPEADFQDGSRLTRSFHFHGFSEELMQRVIEEMTS